jgi:hypothetical protein
VDERRIGKLAKAAAEIHGHSSNCSFECRGLPQIRDLPAFREYRFSKV